MKIGLYTDTHFDVKDDYFLNYQLSIIKNIHDEYHKQNIDTICILGDLFNDRKKIHTKTAEIVLRFYEQESSRFKIYIILGNHDYYNKDNDNYSTVRPIFTKLKNVIVNINNFTLHEFDGLKFMFCNWIFDREEFQKKLKEYSPNVILGHFVMKDFLLRTGVTSKNGFEREYFKNYEFVLSGHFHTKNTYKNITYLGTPYRMNWNDYNVEKYYFVFDTSKRALIEYKQKNNLYVEIKLSNILNDKNIISSLKGKIVRLIIDIDSPEYKDIIDEINSFQPYDLKAMEEYQVIENNEEEIEVNTNLLKSTKEYIDKKVNDDVNKDKLLNKFNAVYEEAKLI